MTRTQSTLAWAAFALLFTLTMAAIRPTEADLQACMKATGWTMERCSMEATR